MESFGEKLAKGSILVYDGSETKEYTLDKEGNYDGTISLPENSRVTAVLRNNLILWEGRIRDGAFKPSKRFRGVLGKEIKV